MNPIRAALRCPDCGAPCDGTSAAPDSCRCRGCGRTFPLLHGVLHMAPKEVDAATRQTVDQFGASWSAHEYLAPYQERQFLDWIAPFTREGFEGRTVLEAGCGKGRHTFLMAGYGVKELLAVDLSEAVYLAAEYTKAFPWVHRIRADLLRLPLQDGEADLVVCLGVLHHLRDPLAGLRELWRVLRPGGALVLWVYAREGNGWIVHLVDPLRKGFTSRVPTKFLRPLLLPLSLSLYAALKLLYGPATGRGEHAVRWLPYSAYLGYISRFPFREIEHIVLDHLCPPIAHYLSRPTLEAWFAGLKPEGLEFRWHNRNSWTVVAKKG